jgi:predicted nucleic acid-binding protein
MGYWDTSCLAKLFLVEADSVVLRAHMADTGTVITGEIARMELWVALRRKEADGDLAEGGAQEALQKFDQEVAAGRVKVLAMDSAMELEFDSVIDQCYSADPQIYLRTLDAIHLASARLSGESEMVTTDRRLRDAAVMLGFTVFPT